MNNIKLIIFDLDGTLIDAYTAISSSFNYVMKKMGYPKKSALVIRKAVGWGDGNLLKPFVSKQDLKSALSLYRRHHKASLIKYSKMLPHAGKVLRQLKKNNYKLAVASNRPTKFSLILIRHLKIEKYFDYFLCADKLKQGKPHPEILHKIMRKLSVKPSQALYVGDMVIDAKAGRRAGVKTIIVTTGSSGIAEIRKEKPYRIIRNINLLLKRDNFALLV